jgi:prepilin-type N-terminal cleavage/methylation domain-containing protein
VVPVLLYFPYPRQMNTHANRSKDDENGFTLVEVMVATMLAAVFFASIFELNAMCLRYIDSSKESLGALQSVQDRAEALRNYAFSDLTRTTCGPCVPVAPNTTCVTIPCVHDLMATPANPSPFSLKATEVVKISQYPTPNGVTQFTRSPNGSVTTDSQATDLGTALVKVDVSASWIMTVGGRARTEQTSCIVSNGTKK